MIVEAVARVGVIERFHETRTWHGSDGPVAIRQMDDEHLLNVIRYLDRRVDEYRTAYGIALFCSGPGPSGDAACDALDQAMAEDARVSDIAWLHSTPLYRALKREKKRRSI